MFTPVFLWKSAFYGLKTISEINLNQMVTYAIVSVLLNALFCHEVQHTINHKIREGEIADDLTKKYPIRDLRIKDPDIEDVIKKILS